MAWGSSPFAQSFCALLADEREFGIAYCDRCGEQLPDDPILSNEGQFCNEFCEAGE